MHHSGMAEWCESESQIKKCATLFVELAGFEASMPLQLRFYFFVLTATCGQHRESEQQLVVGYWCNCQSLQHSESAARAGESWFYACCHSSTRRKSVWIPNFCNFHHTLGTRRAKSVGKAASADVLRRL